MKAYIPRTKIGLSFGELSTFIIELVFRRREQSEQGDRIAQFETDFARMYSMPQGVVFPRARIAFYFLLKEMNLVPGGEVIVSDINVADFVNIIRCAGFTPVVVDVDKTTYCVDFDDLEKKINCNTALLLVTHLSGFVPDMERIAEITTRRGVPFVEDCSQAVSSVYKGQALGTFGDAAIYSFSLLKPVCTLFGGMVISKNIELLERLRKRHSELAPAAKSPLLLEAIKNSVIKVATSRFIFSAFVFPLIRLSAEPMDYFSRFQRSNRSVVLRKILPASFLVKFTWQQAELGLSQLRTVRQRENSRIEKGKTLYAKIQNSPGLRKPDTITGCENAFWLFPVAVGDTKSFRRHLARHRIDSTGYLLSVLSREPAFRNLGFATSMAEEVKRSTIFVPMYAQLEQNQLQQLVSAVASYDVQQTRSAV